jgi:hypothetical protein
MANYEVNHVVYWGIWVSPFKPRIIREGSFYYISKVRTGLGKSDRPGSQGGFRKRGFNKCARLNSIQTIAQARFCEGGGVQFTAR